MHYYFLDPGDSSICSGLILKFYFVIVWAHGLHILLSWQQMTGVKTLEWRVSVSQAEKFKFNNETIKGYL